MIKDILMLEEFIPHMNISCATGFVQNIKKNEVGIISFELWCEVVDSLDASYRFSIFNDSNKFFLLDKIHVYPNIFSLGNIYECLGEDRFVSIVYRSFLSVEGNFMEILLKIEEPNVSNEAFIVEYLSKTINNKVAIERFWLNKIIRSLCFKKGFLE